MKLTREEFNRLDAEDRQSYREMHGDNFVGDAPPYSPPEPSHVPESIDRTETIPTSSPQQKFRLLFLFGLAALLIVAAILNILHKRELAALAQIADDRNQAQQDFQLLYLPDDANSEWWKNHWLDDIKFEQTDTDETKRTRNLSEIHQRMMDDETQNEAEFEVAHQKGVAKEIGKSQAYTEMLEHLFAQGKAVMLANHAEERADINSAISTANDMGRSAKQLEVAKQNLLDAQTQQKLAEDDLEEALALNYLAQGYSVEESEQKAKIDAADRVKKIHDQDNIPQENQAPTIAPTPSH